MANWDGTKSSMRYEADDGSFYSYNGDTDLTEQASLGFVARVAGDKPMGKHMKPRVALVWVALDHTQRGRLVVATPAAYAALAVGDALNFNVAGVNTAGVIYGFEGERHRFIGKL